VRYWLMSANGEALSPSHEIDAAEWLPLAQARERLTYDHDRKLLDFVSGSL
jgi:hypothetical protein